MKKESFCKRRGQEFFSTRKMRWRKGGYAVRSVGEKRKGRRPRGTDRSPCLRQEGGTEGGKKKNTCQKREKKKEG